MKNLVIGTWNIKNSYLLTSRNKYKVDAIIDLLESEKINILGLQEVNSLLIKELNKKLSERDNGYYISSSYEKSMNPIKNFMTEYNLIVTNHEQPYFNSKKIELPSIPTGIESYADIVSFKDRNVTKQSFVFGMETIDFYNTHLDYNDLYLNMQQFDEIYDDITRSQLFRGNDTILVGNLNVKFNTANMEHYVNILDMSGLQVVRNDNRTYKSHTENQPVDYIIVPTSYTIDSVECINDYDKKISTHNPVIVKIKK